MKNGKDRKDRSVLLKRTDAQPCIFDLFLSPWIRIPKTPKSGSEPLVLGNIIRNYCHLAATFCLYLSILLSPTLHNQSLHNCYYLLGQGDEKIFSEIKDYFGLTIPGTCFLTR